MTYQKLNGNWHVEVECYDAFTAFAELSGDGEIIDIAIEVELNGAVPRCVDVYDYMRAEVIKEIEDKLLQVWRDEK